jgi:hypothetical protein
MADFRRNQNQATVMTRWTLHGTGKTIVVYQCGGDGAKKPSALFVDSTDPTIVEVTEVKLVDRAKMMQSVKLKVKAKGTCKLRAWIKGLGKELAVLEISVVDPITLPAINTDEGALARLLLAETRGPAYANTWKADKSKQAMEWMRIVIANRQATPGPFLAKSGSVLDVIKAKGQFHGFESYPPPMATVALNIQSQVDSANNDSLPNQDNYLIHVQNAISVAQAKTLPGDPSGAGYRLVGWRTQGSGSPGGSMIFFQDLGGNSFYKMKT